MSRKLPQHLNKLIQDFYAHLADEAIETFEQAGWDERALQQTFQIGKETWSMTPIIASKYLLARIDRLQEKLRKAEMKEGE